MVAGATCRRVAFAELVDERRIVHQRPGHLHQFEPGVQRPVDALAADESPDIDERPFQLGPELLGVFQEVALFEGELFYHKGSAPADEVAQPQRRVVAHGVDRDQPPHDGHRGLRDESAREDDAVHAERFDDFGDLDALGDFNAPFEAVVHVVLHGDRHAARPGRLHGLAQTHAHEAHAVFERAAVFVVPVVGVGRQELRNEVAVPGVHLHRVESGVAGRAHRRAEVAGHLFDLASLHAPHGRVGVEVESRRGADGHLPGGGPVGHVAAMSDLDGRGGPFAVHGVGDFAQSGDDLGTQPQLLVERQSAAAHGGIGQRGHAHAAAGYGDVVVLELPGGTEVLAHGFEGRRTDRAVAQRDGA